MTQDVHSFETTTKALFELSPWLEGHRCTHVVMEATGVYWKPVWYVHEGTFELALPTHNTSATCRGGRVQLPAARLHAALVCRRGGPATTCSPRSRWPTLVVPQLATAPLAGGILAFGLSFDELIVTTFTAGHEHTLPIWLLTQLGRPRAVP